MSYATSSQASSSITSDDAERLSELRAHDREATTQLAGWIARAAAPFRRKLDHEWDDLRQELMLEVLEQIDNDRYSGRGSLRGFVARVVAHSCIDRIRHHQRWRLTAIEDTHMPAAPKSDLESFLSLRRFARSMPEACQELWRMIVEGYSYAEMGERMGVREGTLRVRVLRCREQARAAWRELGAGAAQTEVSP